jgi:hypothetical protein
VLARDGHHPGLGTSDRADSRDRAGSTAAPKRGLKADVHEEPAAPARARTRLRPPRAPDLGAARRTPRTRRPNTRAIGRNTSPRASAPATPARTGRSASRHRPSRCSSSHARSPKRSATTALKPSTSCSPRSARNYAAPPRRSWTNAEPTPTRSATSSPARCCGNPPSRRPPQQPDAVVPLSDPTHLTGLNSPSHRTAAPTTSDEDMPPPPHRRRAGRATARPADPRRDHSHQALPD